MPRDQLLPRSSTAFERSVAGSFDIFAKTASGVSAMRGMKLTNPPPSWLPFLIYEYGLGELTPYVPNLYELIEEGIDWQRVRGTPAAVAMALGWLNYTGLVEEFPVQRVRWNLFQLELDRVRDDEADMIRIEGVAQLSVPKRSYFWRGFRDYDVRYSVTGMSRAGRALYGSFSGARVAPGRAKWSFGRSYEIDHSMTDAELAALGVWIEPVEEGEDQDLPWTDAPWPDVPWANADARVRSELMLASLSPHPAWSVFRDANGEVIGYRRARIRRPVKPDPAGRYQIGGVSYSLAADGGTVLFVEALTDFGDGFGQTAASVGFIIGAQPLAPHKIGALWLPPGGLATDLPELATTAINIEFGRTVRERVSALLRF